jgi:hypothetical protein
VANLELVSTFAQDFHDMSKGTRLFLVIKRQAISVALFV